MFLIWSFLTIPKHNIHLFPFFISLERDGHSCWNFFFDLLRASDLVLSKWLMVFLVICCSDFVSRRDLRLLTDPEGWSVDFVDLGSWSDLLDALVSWWIFSNNLRRPFRSRPLNLFELFIVLLIDAADTVYFCAFVLFWLEIRLITIYFICFW